MDPQNPPTQLPTEKPVISESNVNNTNITRILYFIIVTLTIVVVGTGGYWLWLKTKGNNQINNPSTASNTTQPTLRQNSGQAPTIQPNEFAGWKTYLYPEINSLFSFKGPSEMKMSGFDASVIYSYYGPSQQGNGLLDGFNIQVVDAVISQPTAFDQVKEELKLNKERGVVLTKDLTTLSIPDGQQHSYFIREGNREYQYYYFEPTVKTPEFLLARFIVSIEDPNNNRYNMMVDAILSTFRFTD